MRHRQAGRRWLLFGRGGGGVGLKIGWFHLGLLVWGGGGGGGVWVKYRLISCEIHGVGSQHPLPWKWKHHVPPKRWYLSTKISFNGCYNPADQYFTICHQNLKYNLVVLFSFFHTATRYGAGRSGDRNLVGAEIFLTRPGISGGSPSLLYNRYWVSFPMG